MPARSIMIMAGGTGGHVYPALAVADQLRGKGVDLFWLGTRTGLEHEVVPKNGIELFTIRVSGLRGKGLIRWILSPLTIAVALAQAVRILLRCRPGAVLGMGGFASGPGGMAAWLLRIPLYIHEQNAVAGLTNRLLFPLARAVMQGFPGTFRGGKVRTTGNPVRRDILNLPLPEVRFAERRDQPLRLLVLGGSLGAQILNETLPRALSSLPAEAKIEIRHQTGPAKIDATRAVYAECGMKDDDVVPYIDDMAAVYAWADVVLCRAGALTVAEIAAVGLASILVPLSIAVDDHQTANARFLSDEGAAVLLPQKELTPGRLVELLQELNSDRQRVYDMALSARRCGRPDAADEVAETCMEVLYA